jgi:hypothetical protein
MGFFSITEAEGWGGACQRPSKKLACKIPAPPPLQNDGRALNDGPVQVDLAGYTVPGTSICMQ